MDSARLTAVKILNKTFTGNSFSNIVLDNALRTHGLSRQDSKFCTALYYGVLSRKITLDHIISGYSKKPAQKLDIAVLNILRCGIYQMLFMNSVPDSAAINECVNLTKRFRMASASGFVNAILRNFARESKPIKLPTDKLAALSVKYSAPEWLVTSLIGDYGEEDAVSFLENSLEKPPLTIRLNTVRADEKMLFEGMGDMQISQNPHIEACYDVSGGDVTSLDAYKSGWFHVQDLSSQLCCRALGAEADDTVLDLCAAPGGKTFTLAQNMGNSGKVYAYDLNEARAGLISDGAKRLGLSNISVAVSDASMRNPEIPLADKILCDVPCSGLGVIRRKPEIKYKNPDEFKDLFAVQYAILENAAGYLKPQGTLIYSTCTLRKSENDNVVDEFLKNHPEFEGINISVKNSMPFDGFKSTVLPKYFNSDGFFMAKLRKIGD